MTIIKNETDDEDEDEEARPVQIKEAAVKTDLPPSDSGCDSNNVSVISLGSESSDEEDKHSCVYCDRVFETRELLSQHSSMHALSAPSALVTSIEDRIYERILAEDAGDRDSGESKSSSIGDPNTSAMSESILDNYDSLIDNLISSESPDELLEKIVITQEIPDAFDEKVISEVEKSETLKTESQPLEYNTQVINDMIRIPILAKSKEARTRPKISNITKIDNSFQDSGPKIIPIKSRRKAKRGHELEDVEFANFINEKVFKILSERGENPGVEIALSSGSTGKDEAQDSSRWHPTHMDVTPCKVPSPSKKRMKRFLESEKLHTERYYKIRDKCSESEESLRKQKLRRAKRGRLAWMVRMETKNFPCPRKPSGWRWEEEVSSDEDNKIEPQKSNPEVKASSREISIQQNIESPVKEDVSEAEDDPEEMDTNEDDRASKLLDSLLLDEDSVGKILRTESENITANVTDTNNSMPVFEF